MLDHLKYDIIKLISAVELSTPNDLTAVEAQRQFEQSHDMQFIHEAQPSDDDYNENAITTFKRDERKVGRNDPCWCRSGKKYKNCHGSLT